ncbi:hypothetical protein [Paenibacillus sp. FSL R10-2734]|uniref:hypothetical protein n=1 Tax=Paenibacillus sp. FSL R10-2734 TaxID=2954691 RepID=UPI0030DBDDD7
MKLETLLEIAGVKLAFSSHKFMNAAPLLESRAAWSVVMKDTILASGENGEWRISVDSAELSSPYHAADIEVEWQHSGYSQQTAVEVRLEFAHWTPSTYVLVPGAVYGGNRFEARELSYPPCWSKLSERGPDTPALITDVPRLSSSSQGPSVIQLLTGDAATPAVGQYDPERSLGFLILTRQQTEFGDTSIHVEETVDRKSAVVSFRAPGMRAGTKYDMCTTEAPSPDRGADFREGDRVRFHFQVFVFPCLSVSGLFRVFAEVRQSLTGIPELREILPFSAAWAIQEEKYNKLNWNGVYGYYSVGTVDMKHQDWQLGWVGGGMSSYALLLEGNGESLSRAQHTVDFIFSGQTDAGFFPGVFYNGHWYGDEFSEDPGRDAPEQWHIVRKSADALYFLVKHFLALNKRQPDAPLPERWLVGTKKLADGFLRLWNSYGQFGQWLHAETGEMLVGGSAGGAMAIGGLALYGWYLKEQTYLATACEAGEYYYRKYTQKGITTGGPGEILQCPDSESAFALLESYMVLYETTGEQKWLRRAEEAAQQAISWCVSYHFIFSENSTFGRLDIQTAGSVIANVQNKHSAPGICTLSGDSLFKLFRASGNPLYLQQLRETAHQLPQYLSREDRPIRGWNGEDLPHGYMSERVNMSDWEGGDLVGEVLPLSCWCEVSNMLTYVEVPGIYVQPDTGLLWVADHVECSFHEERGRKYLTIFNPTSYPASVKLFMELSTEAANPLGQCASTDWLRVRIRPGEVLKVPLPLS